MTAETITFEISVRFFQGDESDLDFETLKRKVKENFERAKFVSPGSAQAKIIDVKIIKED